MVAAKQIKKNISMIFLFVFFTKMVISVMPLFAFLDSKLAVAVIMQLEHENKTDKDGSEKDAPTEKKSFDDHTIIAFEFRTLYVRQPKILHNLKRTLLVQPYHPIVLTPPPNV